MNALTPLLVGVALIVLSLSGCTICQSPFDDHYAAYGGVVERTDRAQGRVNSAFSGTQDPPPTVEEVEQAPEPAPAAALRETSFFGF
jgi:hypothetical protein